MHLSQTSSALFAIPDGVAGISSTLKAMSMFVKQGKRDMTIREKALQLIATCSQKDWACEVRALHAYVRDYIRYVNDIDDVETVQDPVYTLEQQAGDCDDKSTLLAALLGAIGHPTRFVAIGFQTGIYSHVYVETLIGAKWIPLETTEDVEAGWGPPALAIRARMTQYN